MKKVSLLIPIHNRIEITKQGLRSLFEAFSFYELNGKGNIKYDVIIIDDGSTDGSSEWIKENYPLIHVLQGDGNLWWTGAINKGCKFAVEKLKSDDVLLWNDDTVCDTAYFYELEKIFENSKYKDAVLVSKILWLNEGNAIFNLGCYFSQVSGKKKLVGYDQKDDGQFEEVIEVDWSGGMGTLIPVKVLIEVNYFDEISFPQYHGDSDFFLRAKKKGYTIYAIPKLKIWNRRETTGINRAARLKDIKKMILSNQSNFNLKQNFLFTLRHTSSPLAWINFFYTYSVFFTKSIFEILGWK